MKIQKFKQYIRQLFSQLILESLLNLKYLNTMQSKRFEKLIAKNLRTKSQKMTIKAYIKTSLNMFTGEKLTKEEAKGLMNELCDPEDAEGFTPFMRKLNTFYIFYSHLTSKRTKYIKWKEEEIHRRN